MAKTLSEVRDRFYATANIDSNRIPVTRLNEIINDAVAEITSSNRLSFAEKSIPITLSSGIDHYQPEDSAGPLEKPVLWTFNHPTTGHLSEIKQSTIEGVRTFVNSRPLFETTGTPMVYAIWGWANDKPILKVFPTPDQDITSTLDCRIKFNLLVEDDAHNDVTDSAYDAVTYLSLLLAAPYMEDDNRLDTWDRQYQRAISRIRQSHSSARYSGSARRQMREMG